MNTSIANFKITFSSENNKLHVGGSEQNKRKLISHVMSEDVYKRQIPICVEF